VAEIQTSLGNTSAVFDGQAHVTQLILECISEGIVVADLEGRILLFNAAARRFLGAGPEDVPLAAWPETYGLFLWDRITPFPHDQLPLAQAVRGETDMDVEVFVRNSGVPDGASLSVSAQPWRDGAGQLRGGIAVLRDSRADRRSGNAFEHLSNAVEQTADHIVITDKSGRIEYVNPSFMGLTGYTREEVCGRTPRLLKSGKQDPLTYDAMWETLLAGEVFRGTIVNRKKSGQWYSSRQTITPMKDSSGNITHFVSVGRDLGEQEKAEEREIEMRLAGLVQRRLYPPSHRFPGIDIAGAAHPANATGGDYYDYLRMPGGQLGIVVADVSGHGLGAALMMVATRAALRSCVQMPLALDEILDHVNKTLLGDLGPNNFVTMSLASLDIKAQSLTYSSAGHPSGYVMSSSGEIKSVMESTRIPLGIMADWKGQPSRAIPLERGDILVFLTDGIMESWGADGNSFGVENALTLIREHRRKPARQILDHLLEGVHRSLMGASQEDDMTAVICKMGDAP
jgi:sigma-B regulation protein RsbU (phosphoserine phosphatase)